MSITKGIEFCCNVTYENSCIGTSMRKEKI